MNKKLAIKGHPTRGKEVIEILEMLGGVNGKINRKTGETYNIYNGDYFIHEICDTREVAYYIDFESQIRRIDIKDITTYFIVYSLEGFLEQYPYKIGDKVLREPYVGARQICEMRWDTDNNCIKYGIGVGEWFNVSQIQPYKEENMDRKYDVEKYLKVWKETEKGLEVVVNYRFELKEDNGKFYIIKKQPQYPKTYEECCMILQNACMTHKGGYKSSLIQNFQKLLICRNAYWKIAGEQMGLGKPWEPDWEESDGGYRYCIVNRSNSIALVREWLGKNYILSFPTEEMRDAFLENFKDLINACKELL